MSSKLKLTHHGWWWLTLIAATILVAAAVLAFPSLWITQHWFHWDRSYWNQFLAIILFVFVIEGAISMWTAACEEARQERADDECRARVACLVDQLAQERGANR